MPYFFLCALRFESVCDWCLFCVYGVCIFLAHDVILTPHADGGAVCCILSLSIYVVLFLRKPHHSHLSTYHIILNLMFDSLSRAYTHTHTQRHTHTHKKAHALTRPLGSRRGLGSVSAAARHSGLHVLGTSSVENVRLRVERDAMPVFRCD